MKVNDKIFITSIMKFGTIVSYNARGSVDVFYVHLSNGNEVRLNMFNGVTSVIYDAFDEYRGWHTINEVTNVFKEVNIVIGAAGISFIMLFLMVHYNIISLGG